MYVIKRDKIDLISGDRRCPSWQCLRQLTTNCFTVILFFYKLYSLNIVNYCCKYSELNTSCILS